VSSAGGVVGVEEEADETEEMLLERMMMVISEMVRSGSDSCADVMIEVKWKLSKSRRRGDYVQGTLLR